jgi:hypothetical protein
MKGNNYSRLGNEMFPAWEYNIPTLGINTELGDEQTDSLIAE